MALYVEPQKKYTQAKAKATRDLSECAEDICFKGTRFGVEVLSWAIAE
jgi:hypothetical protein